MKISNADIEYIETNLTFYGIADADLREDLIDHICSYAENSDEGDFEQLYQKAIVDFGGYSSIQILQNHITEKRIMRGLLLRKKITYMLSSFNLMVLALGLLFKINQWPYSSWLLASASALLIFGTLPFWFYERYRFNSEKIIQTNKIR